MKREKNMITLMFTALITQDIIHGASTDVMMLVVVIGIASDMNFISRILFKK